MPEQSQTKPEESQKTTEETPKKETPEEETPEEETPEEETPEKPAGGNLAALTSPEGIVMLFIAGIFDSISIICAILIFFFGLGLLLSKIVYIIGLISIGAWVLSRSGALPAKKKDEHDKMAEIVKQKLGKFFKKHWKKLGAKLIPLFGDIVPYWTIVVYKELTS